MVARDATIVTLVTKGTTCEVEAYVEGRGGGVHNSLLLVHEVIHSCRVGRIPTYSYPAWYATPNTPTLLFGGFWMKY